LKGEGCDLPFFGRKKKDELCAPGEGKVMGCSEEKNNRGPGIAGVEKGKSSILLRCGVDAEIGGTFYRKRNQWVFLKKTSLRAKKKFRLLTEWKLGIRLHSVRKKKMVQRSRGGRKASSSTLLRGQKTLHRGRAKGATGQAV